MGLVARMERRDVRTEFYSGNLSETDHLEDLAVYGCTILNFKRRIKSHLPFEVIIRSSPYSTRFQDKGLTEIVSKSPKNIMKYK